MSARESKCPKGTVRNPRTSRCVRTDRALGQSIQAAADALQRGVRAGPCKGREEYDFATGRCVDDARASALRALKAQWGLRQRASNAEAAATAKNVTSKIFNKVRADNYRRALWNKNASQAETLEVMDTLQQQLLECRAAYVALAEELQMTKNKLAQKKCNANQMQRALLNGRLG